MDVNTELLCKDCKHGFQSWSDRLLMNSKKYTLRCKLNYRHAKSENDPVVGAKIIPAEYQLCNVTRFRSEPCGPEGKLWHPKNEKKMFLTWIKNAS